MADRMSVLKDISALPARPTVRDLILPERLQETLESQGMTGKTMLGPGTPMAPHDGYSRQPRNFNYRAGYNIAGQPRINEPVSFATLQALIASYDVAQICITHRVDSLRSTDWLLAPAEGIKDDLTDATKLVREILRYPDRELPFRAWLTKYVTDILSYDAGTLYRDRNLAGQVIGLTPIDGTTIAPVIDAWGRSPRQDPETGEWAPAYRQFIAGVPWNWLTRQDLIYVPFNPRTSTPYGWAPMERVLVNANTDVRFQLYFMQRFTDGNIPQMFAVSPESWTPGQIEDWQGRWDALMRGDQSALNQVNWVPGGTSFEYLNRADFQSEFSLFLMQKTCAAFHVTPADIGWTEKVNKSSGATQADVQERVGDRPLQQHIEDILTGFIQDDLGVPLVFKFDQGTNDEDALLVAQTDQIYVDMGAVSVSKIAEMRFGITELNGDTVPRYINAGTAAPLPISALIDESAPVDQETGGPIPGTTTPPVPVVKAVEDERAAFRRFVKARIKKGVWRDFDFQNVPAGEARRLNMEGRGQVVGPLVKSWRDGEAKWPGHAYDLPLTDHYAPKIQAALAVIIKAVDPAKIKALPVQKADGAGWVTAQITPDSTGVDALTDAIRDARSEAYVTGVHAGAEQLGITIDTGVDWGTWKPGDTLAASKTANLTSTLADLDITVKGIVSTTVDQIGNVIASGLAGGLPSATIGRNLTDLAGNSRRAELIAHTEVARAQTTAAHDAYKAAGVAKYELVTSDGACDDCLDVAANGPYGMDDDTGIVPIHPSCRCANSPFLDDITTSGTTASAQDTSSTSNDSASNSSAAAAIAALVGVSLALDTVSDVLSTPATTNLLNEEEDDDE